VSIGTPVKPAEAIDAGAEDSAGIGPGVVRGDEAHAVSIKKIGTAHRTVKRRRRFTTPLSHQDLLES
jgi:hypothetical protein